MMKLLLVSFLLLGSVSAFLDDLQEALGEAVDLVQNSVPYLKDLYHKLKRAHDFTESILDEDCIYTCGRGRVPRPNPNHEKKSNGCGAINFAIFDDSDSSPVRLDKQFTACCNEHDFCYDTCNADKDLCDLELKKCMYRVCKSKRNEYTEVKPCKVNAKAAYLLTMTMGCQLYKDSQKEACQCVSHDEL